MTATKTRQDIRDIAYAIIKQPQNARAYPLALMDAFIDKAVSTIIDGTLTNLQTGQMISKVSLPFLDGSVFYSSTARTTTTGTTAIGSTTLVVGSTAWFPSSGYLYVKGNKLSYSGITATSFTGIPASGDLSVQFPWEGGTTVLQLYALPADFNTAVLVTYNKQQRLKNIDQRDIVMETTNSYYLQRYFRNDFAVDATNTEYYYSIIDGQYLLFIVPSVSGRMLRFDYQKTQPAWPDSDDVCIIPDKYCLTTVPYLAAAEMMANRGEMNEAVALNAQGYVNTYSMYKFYQSQKTELMYNQRVRTSKDMTHPNI